MLILIIKNQWLVRKKIGTYRIDGIKIKKLVKRLLLMYLKYLIRLRILIWQIAFVIYFRLQLEYNTSYHD